MMSEHQAMRTGDEDLIGHSLNCPELTPLSDERCTCALQERRWLRTEQELHNAWRKRAEEAERKLIELSADTQRGVRS